jgi:hypothetical protein
LPNYVTTDNELGWKTKKTPERVEKLLTALRELGTMKAACAVADVSPHAVYQWRKVDPEFDEAVREAQREAAHKLEDEAWRRAVEGHDVPVVHKGEIRGWYKQASDRMLELLLRARLPELYRERFETTTNVTHEIKLDAAARELLEANSRALGRMIDITPEHDAPASPRGKRDE